jgi:Ca2+-binding RTX toxin-like protein
MYFDVDKNPIRVMIVLALGFCCLPAVSAFMQQTSLGQLMSIDETNETSTPSATKAENTTNIPLAAVNEQPVGILMGEISNISNITSANSLLAIKFCVATANPCLGTDEDDNMTGDDGMNLIYGRGGNDIISAKGAHDEIFGDVGNDNMSGGDDNDRIFGDLGNDYLTGGDGNDYMHGEFFDAPVGGPDIMNGEGGNDEMYGDVGNDNMSGGVGNDIMYGWEDNNELDGGEGNDVVVGWTGNDMMRGNDGDDVMYGFQGSDMIQGGPGNDTIYHNADAHPAPTDPDGSKDVINCGDGYDRAWINTSPDGDHAVNCERVIGGGPNLDGDLDGVPDKYDNCVSVFNPNQADWEDDGIGDACDNDHDNDHILNPVDNCPLDPNHNQKDEDHDGIGDVCDV